MFLELRSVLEPANGERYPTALKAERLINAYYTSRGEEALLQYKFETLVCADRMNLIYERQTQAVHVVVTDILKIPRR